MVHVPLMFLSEWREFPSAPCLAEKKNLMTARVSMLLKSRASSDMLHFSLCNKKRLAIQRLSRPLFPTTLSIPSYDIGKQVRLRTYQHSPRNMLIFQEFLQDQSPGTLWTFPRLYWVNFSLSDEKKHINESQYQILSHCQPRGNVQTIHVHLIAINIADN